MRPTKNKKFLLEKESKMLLPKIIIIIKHCDFIVPALHNLVLLFHIWQAEFHVQPESVSGPDETVHVCLTAMESFQLEAARIWSSAFPIPQSSIHKAGDRIKHHCK